MNALDNPFPFQGGGSSDGHIFDALPPPQIHSFPYHNVTSEMLSSNDCDNEIIDFRNRIVVPVYTGTHKVRGSFVGTHPPPSPGVIFDFHYPPGCDIAEI